ncbi:hypothetical protein [Xanthobacter versatilis]|uniref:hypothetical protein n=1 Tax=Xanthobacter autotrophicus (strain ATCC BAA-1158 / Py2) TaxID=78245 RepID=UPI003729F6EA
MSGLLGGGDSSAQTQSLILQMQQAASQRGAALSSLLAREAEVDAQNKGASPRRSRGRRLLTSLADEDKTTLGG